MEPTDFRELHDGALVGRLHGSRLRRILLQGQMGSRIMVVAQIPSENGSQVALAENNDVVKALAPDGADDPLDIRILPGRARRCENLLDFESMHGSVEVISVDAIAVSDHVARGCVPGEGFDELPSCPFRAGMLCHIEVEDSPSIMRQHQNTKRTRKAIVGTVKKSMEMRSLT